MTKPTCTAQTRGKLWPEKNPVELCAPKRFHYEWQQLTIDVAQLKADAKAKEESAALSPGPRQRHANKTFTIRYTNENPHLSR